MPFVLQLPDETDEPKYMQVAAALRKAIEAGRLTRGQRMPSARDLAKSLGVSVATAGRAYAELSATGYITTIAGSGAFVSETPPCADAEFELRLMSAGAANPDLSEYGKRIMAETLLVESLALNSGAPLVEDLPIKRWQEILSRITKQDNSSLLTYENDPLGYLPLRKALAAYFARSRSVKCSPEQIVVFPQVNTDLIVDLLVSPGDGIVVEDPSCPTKLRGWRTKGAHITALPVDEDGLMVEHLQSVPSDTRLLFVSPSHHDPSGVVLSMSRRQALLDWAAEKGVFILENDYDSEYMYGAPYLPCMQGMDTADRVIYRYTFWRVLYPLIRVSFLILPWQLVPVVKRARLFMGPAPLLEQKALTEFIIEGQLDRHIRRMRVAYEARRVSLIQALTEHFGRLDFTTAGLHLCVQFPAQYDSAAIVAAARESELALASTGPYYHASPAPRNEFMVGFAHHSRCESITQAVAKFARALGTKRQFDSRTAIQC